MEGLAKGSPPGPYDNVQLKFLEKNEKTSQ